MSTKLEVVKAHLVVGNAVGVTMGERAGEAVLRDAIALDPDVIVMVEADEIAARQGKPIKGAEDYRLFHRPNNSDKDGTLIAVRKDHEVVGQPQWNLCTPDNLRGRRYDINPRWSLTVKVKFNGVGRPRKVTGVHFPPKRSAGLLPLAYASMRGLDDDLFAGDLNLLKRTVERHFPDNDVRGVELLHAVAKKNMHLGRAERVTLADSDHPGVRIPFRAKRRVEHPGN